MRTAPLDVLLHAGFAAVPVTCARLVAPEVLELTLDRREPFAPGSHIEVALVPDDDTGATAAPAAGGSPAPLIRHYSLSSDPTGAAPWTIGVRLDGEVSSLLHDAYAPAAANSGPLPSLYIRGPRNNFHFRAARPAYFAAGGIGITPLRAMISFADGLRLDWHLLYVGRTLDQLAYGRELLEAHGPNRVTLWPTAERGRPDLAAEAAPWLNAHPRAVAYACGPAGFAESLATGLAGAPAAASSAGSAAEPTIVEFESFDASAEPPADGSQAGGGMPFVVELAGGRRIPVGAGQSILAALTDAGVRTLSSCRRGSCGTCETRILAGRADHRDHVLTDEEREANESMMICVSRSCEPVLRLDL